jgi:hypothetical protein
VPVDGQDGPTIRLRNGEQFIVCVALIRRDYLSPIAQKIEQ